jgi:hypothetical protein
MKKQIEPANRTNGRGVSSKHVALCLSLMAAFNSGSAARDEI